MNIKSKILFTFGLIFLTGCTSLENKIIDTEIYIKDDTAYSVSDNKKINGVIKDDYYTTTKFLVYKNGKLIKLKKVDGDKKLTYQVSFDDMGLKDGPLLEENGKSTVYSHGVLNGEKSWTGYSGEKVVKRYSDGILNGIQEDGKGITEFYADGVKTKESHMVEVKRQSKNIIWGKTPEKNFTGLLYGEAKKDIENLYSAVNQVEEYQDGVLLSRKYYDEDGEKIKYFSFANGDITKIIKKVEYNKGILSELKHYNLNGHLNGRQIIHTSYSRLTETKNYVDGILHGKIEKAVAEKNKITKTVGFYNKGIYNGPSLNYSAELNYKEGVEVDEKIKDLSFPALVIMDKKEIVNTSLFTGYTREDLGNNDLTPEFLYYYNNGTLKEKYKYSKNAVVESEHYLKNGLYIKKKYKYGLVTSLANYKENGVGNGPYIVYEHNKSKTVGYVKNNNFIGKTIHYHIEKNKEKIIFVRIYKGNTYKDTRYYDYDKKQIEYIGQGIQNEKSLISTGLFKYYDKNGKLAKTINYGTKPVTTKKVLQTYYYPNGKVREKAKMSYCLCRYTGEAIEYYENGKKRNVSNYNENGVSHGVFKTYNKAGKLIKKENYKNGVLKK